MFILIKYYIVTITMLGTAHLGSILQIQIQVANTESFCANLRFKIIFIGLGIHY